MFIDGLYKTLQAGGWILVPIFLVGAAAFYILLGRLHILGTDFYRRDFESPLKVLQSQISRKSMGLKGRSLIYDVIFFVQERKNKPYVDTVNELKQFLTKLDYDLDRGMYLVGVFAAAAPLLGLLGTVGGMVATFETITLYGNSNPVLMAEGISEALITTQSGLVIAFPVILLKHRIEDKVVWIKKQIHRVALQALEEIYGEKR